ncbi:class I SAM-dependent methyltransferase [Henriciella algicola]|uniref:Class I SAM-dependent methyltransferase n=1 Tax=Henriciella algicola TaxID=1608422 RepID=A0A399RMC5_9PROT|nr:class I SAM-dependent methyltransferase [Henriciella algicola]RIJ30855.1 class I SAM-dependent methyltransferase [Henriciella algicola]
MPKRPKPYLLHRQSDIEHVKGISRVDRSSLEEERDRQYAEYWIDEYGTAPDRIRNDHIFPAISQVASHFARDNVVYDFGCGVGNAVNFCLGMGASQYTGFDVNRHFLDAAKQTHESERVSFIRKNFDQSGWERSITRSFDLGLSIFVLNELRDPRIYLRGIRKLCRRGSKSNRISEADKSRVCLVVTHPFLVLKDLSDFYFGRANSRKFLEIESYKSQDTGRYNFSRGNFAIPYTHFPTGDLFEMLIRLSFKIEHFEEIYFEPGELSEEETNRVHVNNQFPKALFFLLKG